MENLITTLSAITPDRAWGIDVVSYFWFNGASVAAFLVFASYYVFGVKKFKPLAGFALLLSLALFVPAMLNLFSDLKQPGRMINFFLYGWGDLATSPMKWGSILLMLYPAVLGGSVYLFFIKKRDDLVKKIAPVGIVIAILTHGYTGYEPAAVHGNLLWHTPLLPLLFLVAAMISGLGVLMFLTPIFQRFFTDSKQVDKESLAFVSRFLSWTLILNLALHALWLSFAITFNNSDKYILDQFFSNYISDSTYLFYSLCFMIPTIVGFTKLRYNTLIVLFSGLFVSIGIWMFRWGIVIGGQAIPRTMPGFLEYNLSSHELISFGSNIMIFIAALTLVMAIFPWDRGAQNEQK